MAQKRSDKKEEEITISTVEEGFTILDETVKRLSDEDISLEDSFSEFEKGMKVLKLVNDKIDRVEKKVRMITEDGEEDFQ